MDWMPGIIRGRKRASACVVLWKCIYIVYMGERGLDAARDGQLNDG